MNKGIVYIVGAGPGDPDLITVKGIWALQQADVLLIDHLAHPNLLQHCPDTVEVIYVGKQKGKHSITQQEINKKLIMFAEKGKTVVRLKGGDPFIFGRVGEELTCLSDHNIPFFVIPGVSSAVAAPGYAGIPLTHRNLSRSVAFVTGTLKRDKAPIEIPNADTIVFLMGYYHLTELVTQLLAQDKYHKNTPIALISNATRANQKTITSTLENIESHLKTISLKTPVLLVVGKVIDLIPTCSWHERLPLFGKRIIICRPAAQAEPWQSELQALGAEIMLSPLIKTTLNNNEANKITASFLNTFEAITFSSSNAVQHFFEALKHNNLDSRSLCNKIIISIGKQTSKTLQSYYITPDLEANSSSQQGLIDLLQKNKNITSICYPTSSKSSTLLESYGINHNRQITRLNLYHTQTTSPYFNDLKPNDIVIFSSPSIVDAFHDLYADHKESIIAIAIGETTAKQLKSYSFKSIFIAESPTIDEIISTLRSLD